MEFNNYKVVPGAKVADLIRFVWFNKREKYYTDDINYYYQHVLNIELFDYSVLGKVDEDPIYLLSQKKQEPDKKNLLILAGVHGEEPAGPWGLMQFINKLDNEYNYLTHKVNLHFIPILNHYGFRLGYRLNKEGLSVNSGYFDDQAKIQTNEGNILKQNFGKLISIAKDGFLNCHENIEADYSYIYCIEDTKEIPPICNNILGLTSGYFGKHPDGKVYDGNLKNGIDFNTHDETLDDYMVSEGKIKRSVTTELPGQQDITKRIDVYEKIILQFVESSVQ
jgi:hypothetical protein